MKRVFIALEIPKSIQQFIGKLTQTSYFANIPLQYEKREKIHLTLAFLGWVKEDKDLATIIKIVNNIGQNYQAFALKTSQLGGFPNIKQPRVVWLGLVGDIDRLQQLAMELNRQLKKQGLKYDQRPLIPHLTLGRVKIKKSKLKKQIGAKISRINKFISSEIKLPKKSFITDTLTIFESQLFRSGSVYKKIKSVKLKILDN